MEKATQLTLDDRLEGSSYLLAGAAGMGSAAVAAATTIRNEFEEDMSRTKAVRNINDTCARNIGTYTAERADNKLTRAQYLDKVHDCKVIKAADKIAHYEQLGYRSGAMTSWNVGILDRAHSMTGNSWRAVTVNSLITAAVTFGGVMMFFNNRHARKQLDQVSQKLDQQQAERGRA